ncbi:glycoside hydrolase family 26 protein [Winogradskyella helgolandensis]|uniref:glycoside hydrolase family 26 protein n=1 Tax=Winogradskyella helgolandensis TaxID=2697010 RepID=UPI0015C8D54C|nr:glycosyl hydrolase [Winogradskyella helgolandensis]
MFKKIIPILLVFTMFSCKSIYTSDYKKPTLVDNKISESSKLLRKKLFLISKEGFAIGHQDCTSYGMGWKKSDYLDVEKSDVFDMIEDQPSVYGFDIGWIEHASDVNLDGVPFDLMRNLMIDAHRKGGIITVSWHLDNPTSGGNSWDATPSVANILEGGIHREKYELWVGRVASFFKSLKYNDTEVPIIFRPFHEMNGSWFWWGKDNCSVTDYKKLWHQTVELLRDKHNVNNLLYTYSPNKLNPDDNYMTYYPGDDFVDILGSDIYDFNNTEEYVNSVVNDLAIVKSIATEKGKLFAFTETGLEKIPTNNWFTEVLYPAIKDSGISWILFWRNHDKNHHYMPYKGHTNELDFKKFKTFPKTLFLKDINLINP